MNEPGYMSLYGIDGGIERLPRELAKRINADVKLNSTVHGVRSNGDETFRLAWRSDGREAQADFDIVVVALPNYWIQSIDWSGASLAAAMRAHHDHFDYPAHYLRVSILFQEPFWRDTIAESYFMIDAFGGCCVYDETSRCVSSSGETSTAAILGWLIGGEMALSLNNLDDEALIARVLDSLPEPLRHGREMFVEGRVHRWVGAVNALPGGFPLREPDSRHVPDPANNPMLFVVGDYLFDSTLNGVLDSAECVAEWITEETAEEAVTASSTLKRPVPTVSHAMNGKATSALASVLNGSGPH
jgi:monoamine oxidase